MGSCNGEGTRINSFALVSYLPEPLAGYLDRLRCDLVSDCHAKAHVTVLPPRPLGVPAEEASAQLLEKVQDFQPFPVELGEIEIFPVTQVIYLSLKDGGEELKRLHRMLNTGRLVFEEPFHFHPHVTLAQDLAPEEVQPAAARARQRWHDF